MKKEFFNPFEDRLSRDIRNDLSEGLARAIETGDTDTLTSTVASYRQLQPASCYLEYLEGRYSLYLQALDTITEGMEDPIQQAVILWNLGLFFEVHEVLEHVWYSAEGEMRATLQALIRAAGVYIKLEYGFLDSAERIAEKAIPVLEANHQILDNYFKPEILTEALQNLKQPPPTLR